MSGSQQQDRHKGVRTFQSGATKRKLAKEKKERKSELLSKMSKMTDFMGIISQPSSMATSSEQTTVEELTQLQICQTVKILKNPVTSTRGARFRHREC